MSKSILIFFLVFPLISTAQAQAIIGYSTQEDKIIFELKMKNHQYVIQEDDGNVVPSSEIAIHSVALAGEFNGWQTDAHPLQLSTSATYQLVLPTDSLKGIDTQFAFVINDYYWVEPTIDAVNRTPAPCWLVSTGAVYTTMLYERTVYQLVKDSVLTDETARQWLMDEAVPMHTRTPAGLAALKQYVKGKQAIGIGHDTISTFTSRSRVTQFLLAGMDYPVVAFQLDSNRATQIVKYLDEGFTVLDDDYTAEVIQVLDWSNDHPEVELLGYEREDIASSLQLLSSVATQSNDSAWQQEVSTLVGDVRSLLDLQQTWGLYYYDSPSYQDYLLLRFCSVRDNLPDLTDEQQQKAYQSLAVINRYLTNLSDLKDYYQNIDKDLGEYFEWISQSDSSLQLVAWVPNEEMSRSTPGSLGQHLSERFQNNYLAVGVGMYQFEEEPIPLSLEQRFWGNDRREEEGNSAYIIDVRRGNLSSEEMQWLSERMYSKPGTSSTNLAESFDIILLINVPEPPVLR
ncbi:hypothetical protein [Tunicatimonas pelagia]|uniref:hypothetical protein n=1 Tax=Tunicatimonas pelagia TaxID=931531 RepID=UPI002666199A|nr:hypothetical protein [Tunicatimonas pelagia]WKN43667.1 hypothetical protein P0M28_01620 [Tunicatimonas pelagia]